MRISGTARLRSRAAAGEAFEVELDDGKRVRVELARNVRFEPRRKRPEDGALVDILAADDDAVYEFAEPSDHRHAPERRLVAITARTIASGPEAHLLIERVLRPPERAPRKTKLTGRDDAASYGVMLLGGALAIIGLALWLRPIAVDLLAAGVILIAAPLAAIAKGRLPPFVRRGKAMRKLRPPVFLVLATALPLSAMFMPVVYDALDDTRKYNGSWASAITLIVWSLTVVLVAGTRLRETSLLRRLIDAPPLPASGELDARWSSFAGVVRDPTPVTAEGAAHAIVHVVSEEVTPGSDPNIYTERVLSDGTFFVDLPDGTSVEVDPELAVWTSTVTLKVPKKSSNDTDYLRAVPLRAGILVAGRVDRSRRGHGSESATAHVKGRETDSLIFVAVRPGQDARAECGRMLAARRNTILVALAVLLVGAGMCTVIEPKLPPFAVPGENAD